MWTQAAFDLTRDQCKNLKTSNVSSYETCQVVCFTTTRHILFSCQPNIAGFRVHLASVDTASTCQDGRRFARVRTCGNAQNEVGGLFIVIALDMIRSLWHLTKTDQVLTTSVTKPDSTGATDDNLTSAVHWNGRPNTVQSSESDSICASDQCFVLLNQIIILRWGWDFITQSFCLGLFA